MKTMRTPKCAGWLRQFLLAFTSLLLATSLHAADDPYYRWAVANFGLTVASDPAQQTTVWGENADPDGDGIRNLLEYTADTDPLASNSLSDVFSPGRIFARVHFGRG